MRTGLDILNDDIAEAMKKYSMSLDELETKAKQGKEWALHEFLRQTPTFEKKTFDFVAAYHKTPHQWFARTALIIPCKISPCIKYHFVKMCKKTRTVELLSMEYQKSVHSTRLYLTAPTLLEKTNKVSQLIHWYETKTKEALARMDAWSLCGIRLNICKDMRVYVAKAIWKSEFFNENQDK